MAVYEKVDNYVLEKHKLFFALKFAEIKINDLYGQFLGDML